MIIFLIVLIVLVVTFLIFRINARTIKSLFNSLSICVFGKRGAGKDVLCSYVCSGVSHNSNIEMQSDTNVIKIKDILIPDLDRRVLTNNEYKPISYTPYEKFNNMTIISDSQIYFPSWDNNNLNKDYKDLPITYAVWRHCFEAGLHFNTQNIERLYIILREQLEDCIKVHFTYNLGLYLFQKVTYYESSKDAINGLKPIKLGLFGGKQETNIEMSKRGYIKDYYILIPRWKVKHNSRYFKTVIFKE